MICTIRFQKKSCGMGKSIWDAPMKSDEFLRITTNVSGEYVLYHCYGLAANGITPLRSDLMARTRTLRDCKRRAQFIYDPKGDKNRAVPAPQYADIRMPYKD